VSDPLIGLALDEKYLLEERLGIGGMGTVYRARHLLIDRPVAVKVLNQRFVEDEAARLRFRREAKAAGRLQHPNAVAVTDFGQTDDGYVYLVMELLVGRTLRDILSKEAPLDPARAVSIMLQASKAVAAAHDAGIIHRDLKPANIFIVQRAEIPSVVKVLDFGIAKLAAESLDEDDPTLTVIGAVIGTPRYMSPEQCDAAELTPAADVYSLGVILYEMLTGMVPFSGSTPLAIAIKHAAEPPRSPREIVSSIPEELENVVLHALEKRPEDRPVDAAEFRRELSETAERLGLENAAITTSPDLDALRDIGTESPSGRLVIDLSRLRETRAAISSGVDLPRLNEHQASANPDEPKSEETVLGSTRLLEADSPRKPARLSIPLFSRRRYGRSGVLVSFVVLLMALALAAVALRWNFTPAVVIVEPTPSPSIEISPSPTPTPAAKRVEKKKPANSNDNKKDSKVGSILKKAGRILKKPF
jgi:serine/threonine protein kinase